MKKGDQFYLDSSFISGTVVEGLINLIPFVGGSIGSVISNVQAARKHQRFAQFLEELKLAIEGLSDKVNKDYINQNDFLDLFEGTSKRIISQRSAVKRDALKNNFIAGMIADDVDYDKVESYEKIIDYLNEESILILLALMDPERFDLPKKYPNPIILPSSDYLLRELFPDIPRTKLEECEILLESQRLIIDVTITSYPEDTLIYDALKSNITRRGNDFSSYVSEKLSSEI